MFKQALGALRGSQGQDWASFHRLQGNGERERLAGSSVPRSEAVGGGGSPLGRRPRCLFCRSSAPVMTTRSTWRPHAPEAWTKLRGRGHGLKVGRCPLEEAIDDAVTGKQAQSQEPTRPTAGRSAREVDVLKLVAKGITNAPDSQGALHQPQHRKQASQLHLPQAGRRRRRHPLRLGTRPPLNTTCYDSSSTTFSSHLGRGSTSSEVRSLTIQPSPEGSSLIFFGRVLQGGVDPRTAAPRRGSYRSETAFDASRRHPTGMALHPGWPPPSGNSTKSHVAKLFLGVVGDAYS